MKEEISLEQFKIAVEELRPKMIALGMEMHARKLDAAILLEDIEKGLEILNDTLRHLREMFVLQIQMIDQALEK